MEMLHGVNRRMKLATLLSVIGITLVALAATLSSLIISVVGAASFIAGAIQYVKAMKSKREHSPFM